MQFGRTWLNLAKIFVFFLIISFSVANFFVILSAPASADDVNDMNTRIESKKKEIDTLQKEIAAYQEQITAKQKESKSLKNQIAILSNEVAKVNLDIEATQARIDQTNLEIQQLNLQIDETEKKIGNNKEKIAEYIRLINNNDQVSYLEVILLNNSFSDFFNQIKYTEDIHSNLNTSLDKLKNDQQDLETQKTNWQKKGDEENKLKEQLQQQRASLTEKNSAQQILLLQSNLTTRQYQTYLNQLQLQQQQINSDIMTLEKTVREKLLAKSQQDKFNSFGPAQLSWPVSPSRGISAYFHDPDYPFRYIFEHPAIDIRCAQGTPIKSPDAGYVARVQFKGDKSYAYVMIIHNNGLSTVYGHVSAVYVKTDDYVAKGQTIALSGALPGSTGAGPLTTGPHLHFEVRLNGIPVNPLEYLPSL